MKLALVEMRSAMDPQHAAALAQWAHMEDEKLKKQTEELESLNGGHD